MFLGKAMLGAGRLGWGSVHIKGGIEVNIIAKGWPAKPGPITPQELGQAAETVWILKITGGNNPQALEMDRLQGPELTPGLELSFKETLISPEKKRLVLGLVLHTAEVWRHAKGRKQKLHRKPK